MELSLLPTISQGARPTRRKDSHRSRCMTFVADTTLFVHSGAWDKEDVAASELSGALGQMLGRLRPRRAVWVTAMWHRRCVPDK